MVREREALAFPWLVERAKNLDHPRHKLLHSIREIARTGDASMLVDYLRSPDASGRGTLTCLDSGHAASGLECAAAFLRRAAGFELP
jgi:hypothetical protein